MSNLQIIARWKIHDGQLEKFKPLAHECIRIVRDKDVETHQFELFFNNDKTEFVFLEKYPRSNALLAHLANLGDLMGKLMAVADFSGEIYGEPSEQLLNAITGLDVKIYSFDEAA
jgi:quinol monooxygenase YgiN